MNFGKLKPGDAFEYKTRLYRVIEDVVTRDRQGKRQRFNAIDLGYPRVDYFSPNASVHALTDEELKRL